MVAWSSTVLERNVTVINRLGLHARASSKLVQLLSSYRAQAFLAARGREVNAKSIMGVMLLAAAQGSTLTLRIDGEDELAAMDAAVALFERYFDEGG
ncbi:MAG: Phosphocarrier protein HPr [Alphaproteobacteria bacterium ADurb.BinA280]|nr:MAG: Phosphocarrier protein HPr [Alphaproteobacteria bacterium ADurb.BinA280]